MTRTSLRSLTALAACAWLLGGCMFKMNHQLPPHTYFGRVPDAAPVTRSSFERHGHKNWALAGVLPYTKWGAKDLLAPDASAQRIEDLDIETIFDTFDTVVWVIPGFAYGYYLWAPRTIRVKGTEVREGSAAR